MRRLLMPLIVIAAVVAACGGNDVDVSAIPELPVVTTEEVTTALAESERPVVLNVWASWCIPCRSEAPLLARAAREFGSEVDFYGLNVRDAQTDARAFIAEFFPTADIEHFHDGPGNIPTDLGGTRGVPLTFFYAAGGELATLHSGVIDERTLALQIDEILAQSD